ncbi:MAG: type II secretion system GspH family protein [Phycisphaerae bacterium]|nr:type II secretion system GspH family protein [Phycisphaerae bacterium]
MFRTSQRGAFTLIELLVVIAIIALLVSILMPSLAKRKELANEAACKMNQHNIYLVLRLYANDNNGALVYANRTTERMCSYAWWGRKDVDGYVDVLPPALVGYMDPLSPGWLCPGWPIDKPYVDNVPAGFEHWLYVYGTPLEHMTNPAAITYPKDRNTPRNMGIGYDYTGYTATWHTPYATTPAEAEEWMARNKANRNFDRVAYPGTSVLARCLPMLKGGICGMLGQGPHLRGDRWSILWADGTIRSVPGEMQWYIEENSVGDWNKTR